MTLADVQAAIHLYNNAHPTSPSSTANPANFFNDFTRSIASANQNWPASVLANGYTICCETKGRRDDILEDQIVAQVRTTFAMRGLTQNLVIPMAIKAVGRSKVYVVEYDAVVRGTVPITLTVISQAMYEFVPPVAGIGE